MRLRLRLAKENVFLSHLEFVRAITRALRRSGLPLQYTGGFHPRVKLSLGPALAVGIKSDSQYVDVFLIERIAAEEVMERLNKSLPQGIKVLEISHVQNVNLANAQDEISNGVKEI